MEPLVQIDNLTVRYGAVLALQNLSLRLNPGHIVAVVGANGAGKTTLFRTLFGEQARAAGTIRICGLDPFTIADRRKLWQVARWVTDTPQLYEELTCAEYLEFSARAYGVPEEAVGAQVRDTAGNLGLIESMDLRIKTLSLGTQRKVHVAAGFFSGRSGPRVLVLDEPTNGLDPPSRLMLAQVLRQYVNPGQGSERAVLISSHNLAELNSIADYAVMIKEGQVVASGPLRDLAARLSTDLTYELTLFDENAGELARCLQNALDLACEVVAGRTLIFTCPDAHIVQQVVALAVRPGSSFRVREMKERLSSLERVFIQTLEEPGRAMNLPARFPYLVTLARAHWRSGSMSLGLGLALLASPILVFLSWGYYHGNWKSYDRLATERAQNEQLQRPNPALFRYLLTHDYGQHRHDYWFIPDHSDVVPGEEHAFDWGGYLVKEGCVIWADGLQALLMCWAVGVIGVTCQRESKRLITLGAGRFSSTQLLVGLLVGPAALPWLTALGLTLVLPFLGAGDGSILDAFAHQGNRWRLVVVAALLVVFVQAPRSLQLRGHALALILGAACLVFPFLSYLAFLLARSERADVAEMVPWLLDWMLAGALAVCLWNHAGNLLQQPEQDRIGLLFPFLLPSLVAAVVARWVSGGDPAVWVSLAFSGSLFAGASALWAQQADPALAWPPGRIRLLAGLALLAAVLLGRLVSAHDAAVELGSLVAGLLLVVALARLLAYLLFLDQVARRFFSWQSLALMATYAVLEGRPFLAFGLTGDSVAGCLAQSTSTAYQWHWADSAGLLQAGPVTPSLAPLFAGSALVLGIGLVVVMWGLFRGAGGRPSFLLAPQAPRSQENDPETLRAESGGPLDFGGKRVAAIAPLLAIFAREQSRGNSFVVVALLGFLPLLYLGFSVATTGEVAENLAFLIPLWQCVLLGGGAIALFTRFHRDRQDDRLLRHAFSALPAWQVALGYALGPAWLHLLAILVLQVVAVWLGSLTGKLEDAIKGQLSIWKLVLVIGGGVVLVQSRPLRGLGKFVPLGCFLVSIACFCQAKLSFGRLDSASVEFGEDSFLSYLRVLLPFWAVALIDVCLLLLGLAVLFRLLTHRIHWIEGKLVSSLTFLLVPPAVCLVSLLFTAIEQHGTGFPVPRSILTNFQSQTSFVFFILALLCYLATGKSSLTDESGGRTSDRRAMVCLPVSLLLTFAIFLLWCLVLNLSAFHSSDPGLVTWGVSLHAVDAAGVLLVVGLVMAARLFAYGGLWRFISLRFPELHFITAVGTWCVCELFLPWLGLLAFRNLATGEAPWWVHALCSLLSFSTLFQIDLAGDILADFPLRDVARVMGWADLNHLSESGLVVQLLVGLPHLAISLVVGLYFAWRVVRLRTAQGFSLPEDPMPAILPTHPEKQERTSRHGL